MATALIVDATVDDKHVTVPSFVFRCLPLAVRGHLVFDWNDAGGSSAESLLVDDDDGGVSIVKKSVMSIVCLSRET